MHSHLLLSFIYLFYLSSKYTNNIFICLSNIENFANIFFCFIRGDIILIKNDNFFVLYAINDYAIKSNFISILLYEVMLFSIYSNFTFLKIIYNDFEGFVILSLIILIFVQKKKQISYVIYVKINYIYFISIYKNR